jgi:hypothetical protein
MNNTDPRRATITISETPKENTLMWSSSLN